MTMIDLSAYESDVSLLEPEWIINIQIPVRGLSEFCKILGDKVPLIQGNYSHCMYIRDGGRCRFKGNEGAHGGVEETIQEVESAEIIMSIPQDNSILENILNVINHYHVHEEPTVRITNSFGLRSRYKTDVSNPNKYWNRSDRKEIHGTALKIGSTQ